ncbi:MAG: carboxypeptidase-like regulatory domain-containing protein [Prevotella sp.]|nr:carboxypeptidase-like regulatory domain-containing protein [Prevotella sp.]
MKHKCNSLAAWLMLLFISMLSTNLYAQGSRVTGTVKDANGDAIIGASVIVAGSSQGSITDVDGKYAIAVPSNAKLQVSSVGYETQTVAVGGRKVIDFVLQSDDQQLDDIVVIGYGTVKKRDLTGAVSSVKAADIVRTPTGNALEAIQGQVTGLDITNASSV